ncbi:MAG TPA: flagellar basal body-associated FliL family protein [Ilumatobacteraceae bacterium]|nr:flagellar basal body-associated FliL family protein [Ilumatobacteraceae bacterium]
MSKKTTTPTDPDAPDAAEAPKKSKKKLFIALGLVVVLGGVGYMLLGRSKAADADVATDGSTDTVAVEAPAALEFSEIVDLPATNINLADGHYLRVAVSLGLHAVEEEAAAEGGHAAVESDEPSIPIAPAADLVVAIFSGRTMASLATPEGREEAKTALTAQIIEHYGATVASVFLTEFVMQ